jgi:hypothetical protein
VFPLKVIAPFVADIVIVAAPGAVGPVPKFPPNVTPAFPVNIAPPRGNVVPPVAPIFPVMERVDVPAFSVTPRAAPVQSIFPVTEIGLLLEEIVVPVENNKSPVVNDCA